MNQTISSLCSTLSQQLAQEQEAIENDRKKLRTERENFEAEKKAMTKIDTKEDDILELNVGGKIFVVKRSTMLLAPEDSHLNAMFSGRSDESLSRDAQGRIFLDITPYVFGVVLSYLRAQRLASKPEKHWSPDIQQPYKKELKAVYEYFNLFGTPKTPKITMKACHTNNEVRDGNVVKHESSRNGHSAAISAETIDIGTYWKVKVGSLKDNNWVHVGIIASDAPTQDSYKDSTSFGWANNSAQVWINGQNREGHGGWTGWQQGDEAILILEKTSLKMYHKRLQRLFTLDALPVSKAESWRVHLNLYSPNDQVEVLVPTDEECGLVG